MKILKGQCTFCGKCGCWDRPEPNGKNWCEGLPEKVFRWYKQHPELEEPLHKLLREKMEKKQFQVAILGKGNFSFVWREKIGVCISETDKSCPFFDQITKRCRIWDTDFLPRVCKTTPQCLTNERQIKEWFEDHPDCGFYWVDE